MRYALARLLIAVGRMVTAAGWMLIPPDRRLGHYIGSTFRREKMIEPASETAWSDRTVRNDE